MLHSGHGCVVYCRDRGREARARAVVRPVARDAAGDVAVAPPLGRPEVAAIDDLLAAVVLEDRQGQHGLTSGEQDGVAVGRGWEEAMTS